MREDVTTRILKIFQSRQLNGDAYLPIDRLHALLCPVDYDEFLDALSALEASGDLCWEEDRIYSSRVWSYEDSAAAKLDRLLRTAPHAPPKLPSPLRAGDLTLTTEQRDAVRTALSQPLTVILGGAGSGKTSVVRAIADRVGPRQIALCAPTGIAARNLRQRSGLPAGTVHTLLRIPFGGDFLHAAKLDHIRTLIVDEASMVTTGMLSGLLAALPDGGSLVLLGDPNQLPAVGAGNVLSDLEELGFPVCRLTQNHRQAGSGAALHHNAMNFRKIHRLEDFRLDDGFHLFLSEDPAACREALVDEAARWFRQGASVQVLAHENRDVCVLNWRIQNRINPPSPDKPAFWSRGMRVLDGDRVMVTRNDAARGVVNGDIGTLGIDRCAGAATLYLPDGRTAQWAGGEKKPLVPAYAVTVHKSQGCEFDVVLMLCRGRLDRNLLYTAISRAKRKVVLYGASGAINRGMQTCPPQRLSQLVEKTRMHSMWVA